MTIFNGIDGNILSKNKKVLVILLALVVITCGEFKGDRGSNGSIGSDGVDAVVTLTAVKKHNPSEFLPQKVNFVGSIFIPKKLYVTKGCGSNDGSTDKAAQLIIDSSIVCRYNPGSSLNKPCQSGNQSQIKRSKTYELVNCDLGYQSDDLVTVNNTLKLNLSKADSSEDEVELKAVINKL